MSEPVPGTPFPPLVLAVYIACVAGAGFFANCALLAALFKCTKNGLICIIIQLALADILLLGTSSWLELWSTSTKTWVFGRASCIAYRGLSILASSASLYLITTMALHSLATVNLEEKAAQSTNKNDDDEEIRCSRHSLVASDTSTPPRTMHVDYRLVNTKVAIVLPTIFVWILSASLSVPEFTLATTVKGENDAVECTLIDSSHKRFMHSMLSIFNLFLPLLILSTAGALIICKLKNKKKLSRIDAKDSIAALKVSLCLIIVFYMFSAPRLLYYVYGLYVSYTDIQIINNYKISINLILCAINLLAYLIRPVLCIFLLPKVRNHFVFQSKSSMDDNT